MSRLFGVITQKPVDYSISLSQPQHAMLSAHGWGVGWVDESKNANIKKGVRSTLNPHLNQPVHLQITASVVLFHLRQATSGTISEENTHPFSYKNYLFAHMGSINKEDALSKLTPPYNTNFQSEPIDSEVYFRLIMQNTESQDIKTGIKQSVSQITSSRGANFILGFPDNLYTYRYGHPLYWTRWKQSRLFDMTTTSGVRIVSNGLSEMPAIITSSEKSFEGNWTALDEGELFAVEKNLNYESIQT